MNTKFLTACFVVGSLLAPVVAMAADGDTDRKNPVAFVKDSAITAKIKAKLAADKLRSLTHVSVDTDANGMVVLSGTAKTQEDIDRAGQIARETERVTSVQNNIKIKKDD
ncbi:MAG TPA: BON domain-containing protein [Ideonella sp.]|nr:BON domain-containing protein [Ideonella sp.]